MRMARFNTEACYTQGKNMFVADTLSRSPIKHRPQDHIEEEVIAHVSAITSTWPASDAFLDRIRKETEKGICLKTALENTMTGWPEFREDVKLAARNLYAVRGELSGWDGILIKGERIVIPYSMQKEVLEKIHEGHQGIAKCRERARQTVWWPQISREIKDCVSKCSLCLEKQPSQPREPLLLRNFPIVLSSA